jgi:membrane-bound serine protease (ClpP class)
MGVSLTVALSVSAAFALITVWLVKLAMRARHMKTRLGVDALVGRSAKAMEALTPEGHVLVEGEIWTAVASEPVAAGEQLLVSGHEQYVLHVTPTGAKG